MGGLPLPPPMKVSPTIKFFRWTFLITGFYYGAGRHSRLAKREVKLREEARKKKVIRDAQLAEQRRIASEKDIAMLAALAEPDPNKSAKK